MNWGELKKRVEAAGVKNEDEIGHIDLSSACLSDADPGCPVVVVKPMSSGLRVFFVES